MPPRRPLQQAAAAPTSIPARLPPTTSTRPHPNDIRAKDPSVQSHKLSIELARFLCFFTDPKTGQKYFKGLDVDVEGVSSIRKGRISVKKIFERIYDRKYANAGKVLLDIERCLEQVEDERKEEFSIILDTLWSFFSTFPPFDSTDPHFEAPPLCDLGSVARPTVENHEGFLHISDYLAKYMMADLKKFTTTDGFSRWSYLCDEEARAGLPGMDMKKVPLESWLKYLKISHPTQRNSTPPDYEAFVVPIQLAFARLSSKGTLEGQASQPYISTSSLSSSSNTTNATPDSNTRSGTTADALSSSLLGSVAAEDLDEDLQEEEDVEGSLRWPNERVSTRMDVEMEAGEDGRDHHSPEPAIRSIKCEDSGVDASFFSTPYRPTSTQRRPHKAVSSRSPRESFTSSSTSSQESSFPASSSELDEPRATNQRLLVVSSSPSSSYVPADSEPSIPSTFPGRPPSSFTKTILGNPAAPAGQKRQAAGPSSGLASTSASTSNSTACLSSASSSSLPHPVNKKLKFTNVTSSNATVSGALPQHQPLASGSSVVVLVPQATSLAVGPPTTAPPPRTALEAIDASMPNAIVRDLPWLWRQVRELEEVKKQNGIDSLKHRNLETKHASLEARSSGQKCELELARNKTEHYKFCYEKAAAKHANKVVVLRADLDAEKLKTRDLSTSLADSETARTALETELDLARLEIVGLANSLRGAETSFAESEAGLSACHQALDSQRQVTQDLEDSLASATRALDTSRETITSLRTENDELRFSLSDSTVELEFSQTEVAEKQLAIQKLRTSESELTSSLASSTTRISELKRSLDSMVTSDEYTDLQIEFRDLEDELTTEIDAHSETELRALASEKGVEYWTKLCVMKDPWLVDKNRLLKEVERLEAILRQHGISV